MGQPITTLRDFCPCSRSRYQKRRNSEQHDDNSQEESERVNHSSTYSQEEKPYLDEHHQEKEFENPIDIESWEFDSLLYSHAQLIDAAVRIFHQFEIPENLQLSTPLMFDFVHECRNRYRDNPFHNFAHAVAVLQASYLLVKHELGYYLEAVDIFGLLIASLCHDLDHRGRANGFEVQANSELAQKYGKVSVLENHHMTQALEILNMPKFLPLVELNDTQRTRFTEVIRDIILYTDMAKHNDVIADFQKEFPMGKVKQIHRGETNITMKRNTIMRFILHCADLSNPIRTVETSVKWSMRCNEEFSAQVSEEKERGYKISVWLVADTEIQLCKNEIGFIEKWVQPLWDLFCQVFPEMHFLIERVQKTKDLWKLRLEELEKNAPQENGILAAHSK